MTEVMASLAEPPQAFFKSHSSRIEASEWLDRFVRLAAKTVNTAGSFLLLYCEGEFTFANGFGEADTLLALSWQRTALWDLTTCDGPRYPVCLQATADASLMATITLQRNGVLLGVLGVCDANAKLLSAAQEYVLQAIAVEVADHLESEHQKDQKGTANLDLLARLRLLESVVVNANDSVLITEAEPIDLPGPVIRYVNPAFTRTTGYTFEEVVGKTPRILQGPLTDPRGPARIRAALKAWEPVEVELLNYRKDGSTFWVELSISPVCDEKGWYTHWVSVQRDVTERKANEESLALIRATTLQNQALTEEIRERKLIEAELSHVAFHDGLTGVRNRSYFMEGLGIALKRVTTRKGYRAAVLYVDLDGFKAINDTYGHRIGDLLLSEIAQRLQGCARTQDTVARLGGDEFTLLIDDLDKMEQAIEVGKRMLDVINQPVLLAGALLQVSGSIGICEVNAGYQDAESILRDADLAMYRAKEQGGTRCVLFNESMHENALSNVQRKLRLKAAIGNQEFELFYQPLLNLRNASIYGVEALIRWHHPERGLLEPGDFIHLAEDTGYIVPIGLWVLQQACSDFKLLKQATQHELCLSVNVSSRQLDEANFLAELSKIIQASAIDPRLLQLEITESIFLNDAERIGSLFEDIRALGVKIAFDDFGTGYSSLSYLERYPIDTLKIDQTFVHSMGQGSVNMDIIQMIIKLAEATGMSVSAEGVETSEQAEALLQYGCFLAQGFLYSQPLSLGAMAMMLLREHSVDHQTAAD